MASVLESMEFCLKLRGSEACVLEDLAKAIDLIHVRRNLVESGHALLNHAHRAQQDYDRYSHLSSFHIIMLHEYLYGLKHTIQTLCIFLLMQFHIRGIYMR